MPSFDHVNTILTDIEGTTTSVSFVYDTLFPYFNQRIDSLLNQQDNLDISTCFDAIKQQLNSQAPETVTNEQVIQQLKNWVAEDKKEPQLKMLQGILWKEAYLSGEIKGHLYPEVADQLRAWKTRGISLNVYSSGSVAAQKLLFGYSEAGDLRPLFDDYFDTKVGHKRETVSYQNIAQALQTDSGCILFLSDVKEELDAAKKAGMQTVQLVRPGTPPCDNHSLAENFEEIHLET